MQQGYDRDRSLRWPMREYVPKSTHPSTLASDPVYPPARACQRRCTSTFFSTGFYAAKRSMHLSLPSRHPHNTTGLNSRTSPPLQIDTRDHLISGSLMRLTRVTDKLISEPDTRALDWSAATSPGAHVGTETLVRGGSQPGLKSDSPSIHARVDRRTSRPDTTITSERRGHTSRIKLCAIATETQFVPPRCSSADLESRLRAPTRRHFSERSLLRCHSAVSPGQ